VKPELSESLIEEVVAALSKSGGDALSVAAEQGFPDREAVIEWLKRAVHLLLFERDPAALRHKLWSLGEGLLQLLERLQPRTERTPVQIVQHFLSRLPAVREILAEDVAAAFEGDPAAESLAAVLVTYPAILAIAVYRVAHEFYTLAVPLLPRMMTEYAHGETGIDINPGAKIGRRFFIDHGTGVVIGETCEIGDGVRLYQGVTLGALSPRQGQRIRGRKRHPTIQDGVTIYPGATILGGETVIGCASVIGGNAWITESVPPGSKVVPEPPRQLVERRSGELPECDSQQRLWEI